MNIFDENYFEIATEDSLIGEVINGAVTGARQGVEIYDYNKNNFYKMRVSSPVVLYKADLRYMDAANRSKSWDFLLSFINKNKLNIFTKGLKKTDADLRMYDFIGVMTDKVNKEYPHPNYSNAKRFAQFLKSNKNKISKADNYKEFVAIVSQFRI